MKNLFLLLLLGSTLSIMSCKKEEKCLKSISVTILDEYTGEPIPNAQISELKSLQTPSSTGGNFEFYEEFEDLTTDEKGQFQVETELGTFYWSFFAIKDGYSVLDLNSKEVIHQPDCGYASENVELIPLAYLQLETVDNPDIDRSGFNYDSYLAEDSASGYLEKDSTVIIPIIGGRASTINIRFGGTSTEVPIYALPGVTITHTVEL